MSSPRNRTVLVVADIEALQRIYRDRLNFHGFTHVLARDGNEALRILSERLIDIVLLDLVMPPMSAGALAAKARINFRQKSHLPIVLIAPQQPDIGDTQLFDKVLSKPCEVTPMINAIEDLLQAYQCQNSWSVS